MIQGWKDPMVVAGQYLERSVVIDSGGTLLDGLYHRGERAPACAIAAPHPDLGGSMSAPAVAELAWAITRAGHATLRFDYRGVGASQGELRPHAFSAAPLPPAALAGELDDLRAAAGQLAATVGASSVCAVGYSFGAAVALAAASDALVSRVVLVAPPLLRLDFTALAQVKKPVLVVAAHHDPLCDRAALQALLAPLGELGELAVIPHADPSFRRGLQEMAREVTAFLARGAGAEAGRARAGRGDEDALAAPGTAQLELEEGGEPLELDDGATRS
jgi:alpha/beta superfamily hydrolase